MYLIFEENGLKVHVNDVFTFLHSPDRILFCMGSSAAVYNIRINLGFKFLMQISWLHIIIYYRYLNTSWYIEVLHEHSWDFG